MSNEQEPTKSLSFDTIVVPLASERDADATCEAIRPYLSTTTEVIVVHVIQKAGGGIDSASVDQRKRRAHRIFARCEGALSPTAGSISSTINYDTDVEGGVLESARNRGADAIVFTPRGANRLVKFISGDIAFDLIHQSEFPVLILPRSGSNK